MSAYPFGVVSLGANFVQYPPHIKSDSQQDESPIGRWRSLRGIMYPSPPLGGEGQTARSGVRERGESTGGAGADPRALRVALPPSPSAADAAPPSPPKGGEGRLPDELPDELKVFDYIYGVLHSPDYRRTYAQFLKIDFPRIPYPASPEVFAHVAEKGGQLRRLHLMEDAAIGATPYPFKGDGDNVVVKPALSEDGRVMINPDQYFEGVPAIAWEFHIGGYQPAQKWLKDRKGRALSFDDVIHYQKIIKILCETDRIMKEIILPL
jgi:Type ISP C-terminal specificity domain